MLKSEAQQYIHYSKGSLVMNAIRAKIGEDNVNQALRALIEDYGPNSEVFATTLNLVASLKRFADEQYHDFIDQQFSQITLYDLRVSGVSIVESSTENSLDVVIQASQYLADGRGIETEQPFKAKVDLVVFDGNPAQFAQPPKILHRVEVALSSGENNISLPYIEGAEFVAVDPFVKFIDRDSQNNIRKIR
jgi:ABC-2 type transport system permease protein